MYSDPSEPAASSESANRRMSNDMSGPLSDKPEGTTPQHAQVTKPCLPAGQRPNKTPIFISGATDTRTFLFWLRASCPGGLTAQLKGEKLMVVPSTADGFTDVVSTLRSLDEGEGVSFHTFTLPEDRCVRLLVKNLGRGTPESVVREELETLNIRVQGVMQLRSGLRDQDPTKDRPPTPHFIISVARGPQVSKVRSLTELCGLRVSVESYVTPKGPLQCKRCQRFGHTPRNCEYALRCVACVGSHLSGGCHIRREQPQCCGCGVTTLRNTEAGLSGKKRRRLLQSRRPSTAERATSQVSLPHRKLSEPDLLPSRWTCARVGATLSEGGAS
jgi:hypothetical protein